MAWWADQAERITWDTPLEQVLEWDLPFAKWFVGGKLNASVNCVDRHVAAGRGDKVAFHWVGEPEEDTRTITYGRPARHGLPGGERPGRARGEDRRPGRHLHADDPRDGGRHAGLRPARAPRTRSSSAASRPRPWPAASSMPTPGW